MILGITGLLGSGKDTAAAHLMSKSFYHISFSDLLREELKRRGVPETRDALVQIGNELREKFGAGVLAELALRRMSSHKNWVLTSIRNPEEVRILKQQKDFALLFIDAPLKDRYDRIKQRAGPKDTRTFEQFSQDEERELKGRAHEQNLLAVKRLSRITISNNGTLEQFQEKLDRAVQDLYPKLRIPRPGWDQYYLTIANAVALRGNCMKRKVAAIIVKDQRIISTGYNGTPRGVKNCDEGGCKRCNTFTSGGTALDSCVCSHAEENAIVQAAYHGISVKDGTLYSTFSPCITCSKMIINAGIRRVVYNADYPLGNEAKALLREAGVKLDQMSLPTD